VRIKSDRVLVHDDWSKVIDVSEVFDASIFRAKQLKKNLLGLFGLLPVIRLLVH
jgi:hypothetical protein